MDPQQIAALEAQQKQQAEMQKQIMRDMGLDPDEMAGAYDDPELMALEKELNK